MFVCRGKKSWFSCVFLLKLNLVLRNCNCGILCIIVKSKNSICIVLVMSSYVCIFWKIKLWMVCLKWWNVFMVLLLKSVLMLMFGIWKCVFLNCMMKIMSCVEVFILICMCVNINVVGCGWMIVLVRCVRWMVYCKSWLFIWFVILIVWWMVNLFCLFMMKWLFCFMSLVMVCIICWFVLRLLGFLVLVGCCGMWLNCWVSLWKIGVGSWKCWCLFLVIMKLVSCCWRNCWIKCWWWKIIRWCCLFCVNWSLVCLIFVCMWNLICSKGWKFLRCFLKLKNRLLWCCYWYGVVFYMCLVIFLLVVMW